MKKILLFLFLLLPFFASAKIVDIAGWGIIASGDDPDRMRKADNLCIFTLIVDTDRVIFSLWDAQTQKTIIPSMVVECLYIDPDVTINSNYIGMKSKIKFIDNSKSGTLIINMSKKEEGIDIIKLDFPGENDIYFAAELAEESMFDKIVKLAETGIILKEGFKLKKRLDDYMLEDD